MDATSDKTTSSVLTSSSYGWTSVQCFLPRIKATRHTYQATDCLPTLFMTIVLSRPACIIQNQYSTFFGVQAYWCYIFSNQLCILSTIAHTPWHIIQLPRIGNRCGIQGFRRILPRVRYSLISIYLENGSSVTLSVIPISNNIVFVTQFQSFDSLTASAVLCHTRRRRVVYAASNATHYNSSIKHPENFHLLASGNIEL